MLEWVDVVKVKITILNLRINLAKLTIDLEESCEVRGSGGIFGHTGVSAHVYGSGRLDCQRANFSANFTDDKIRAASNLWAIEKPGDCDRWIAFSDRARRSGKFSCVQRLVAKREWSYLGQNWKKEILVEEIRQNQEKETKHHSIKMHKNRRAQEKLILTID